MIKVVKTVKNYITIIYIKKTNTECKPSKKGTDLKIVNNL